jgi:hypothetical protein
MKKREFLRAGSLAAFSAFFENPAIAQGTGDEHDFWSTKAALLDARLYEYHFGRWELSVPDGETWYLLSAWHVYLNGNPVTFFQRSLDASQRTLALPRGTKLHTEDKQDGYVYICRPNLVTYSDPKETFYRRMRQISTLPVQTIGLEIPAGSPAAFIPEVHFPGDFEGGMITSVSSHDIAWSGLKSPPNGGLNTENEISDDHQMRFAGPALIPFKRSVFPIFFARSASEIGISDRFSSLHGMAMLTYLKLPSEW